MSASETSPAVMILITIAAAITLFAWWLSHRNNRRTRALIAYLKEHHEPFWRSLPWHWRNLTPAGAIEAFRRSGRTVDPEFQALYQARKSGSRALIFAIVMALALIGVVLTGTTLWGWSW